jgi:hypothetical protein
MCGKQQLDCDCAKTQSPTAHKMKTRHIIPKYHNLITDLTHKLALQEHRFSYDRECSAVNDDCTYSKLEEHFRNHGARGTLAMQYQYSQFVISHVPNYFVGEFCQIR